MQRVFYNILLPVDLGRKTEASVQKAVHLANKLACNLHLHYTMPPRFALESFLPKGFVEKKVAGKRATLSILHRRFVQEMNTGCLLVSSFHKGDVLEQTIQYALEHSIDLICYDDSHSPFKAPYLDIQRLASAVPCPVLLGSSQPGIEPLDKIVLPVGEQLSAEHVRVAIYMAQQLGAAIHLVSDDSDGNSARSIRYLTKTYELLKDNTGLELVCSTATGQEPGQSTLHYAQSVRAGLIVANRENSLLNESFSFLPAGLSRREHIPVLLV